MNGGLLDVSSMPLGPNIFALDGGHELYAWEGVWRLGLSGINSTYIATIASEHCH
jgi:hypothetical protein